MRDRSGTRRRRIVRQLDHSLALKNAIDHLDERERGIVIKRFFSGKTQMEVAREIGISQAQVSRLEKAALKEMRRYV